MWGDDICDKAESLSNGQLIVMKGAKVSDYGGKSLNISGSSKITIDSDNKDA